MTRRLGKFNRLFSSNLLEAELRSALAREGVTTETNELLRWVSWVHPNRALTPEFDRILPAGYLKGLIFGTLPALLFLPRTPGNWPF